MSTEAANAARKENAQDPECIRRRFLAFVVMPNGERGCWLWIGARADKDAYGFFWLEGKLVLAHRASYIIFKGPIPPRKKVLHSCDVKHCVAPHHIRAGTTVDNARDAIERGQIRRGETNGMAQLNEDSVRAIRRSFIPGLRGELTRLAKAYGVTLQNIDQIVRGKTWRHVL